MPAYFSNILDATLNTQITIGTTVTFFSFYNFSISSRRNWYFSIFSNLRSGVYIYIYIYIYYYYFFFCFFASFLLWLEREKQKTDYRDKGRRHDRRLYFLQFLVFYSCIARDSYVYDLSLLCLLINEDDVRPSSFSHPITLYIEIPYHLLWGMSVPLICSFQFGLPTQLPMYIPHHIVMSPFVLTLG